MKLILLAALSLSLSPSEAACPAECYCFGYNGEWIADCARKGLKTVSHADFDNITTEIHMQYNEIETLHENTFASVPKLKHLYLQSNKITALPDGIFRNLPVLETLRLNSNRISNIGTRKFADLKKLKLLYIHNNDLEEVVGTAFTGLDDVEQISVAGNPNLANIAPTAFGSLGNLTMIDLSGSALTSLNPAMVQSIEKLKKVYTYNIDTLLCDERLERYLSWMLLNPRKAFGRATMVCAEPKNLRGRSVVSVDPDRHFTTTGDCPDECACFSSGASVIADCSSRGLTSAPYGFAPETTEIALQNNNIEALSNNDFLHLTKLEFLYLHDNQLDFWDVNAFTGAAQTLRQLTLNNNYLGSIPVGVFRGMRSLEVLNLNDNNIGMFRAQELSDMFSLVQLSINNNSMRAFAQGSFENLASLKNIGLAHNRIESLPDNLLANSPNLYFADISGNSFTHLPKIPPTLTRFDARDSGIISLSPESFSDASNLQLLDLSGNKVYVIDEGTFAGAKNLQQIDLSGNHMEEITGSTFASAPDLTLLDLSSNKKLSVISDDAFLAQRHTLQRLYLSDGGLRTMASKPLTAMERSNFYATLEGNPWNCDCKLEDLALYISAYGSKVDDPTCVEPKSESGKKVVEVTYVENCKVPIPEDDSKALVISLSIVGAVLIFGVVVGVVLCSSKKKMKDAVASGISHSGRGYHSNDTFDHADEKSSVVQL